jgi:ankyrin repeat protein
MVERSHSELVECSTDGSIELSDVKAVDESHCQLATEDNVKWTVAHRLPGQNVAVARNDIFLAARSGDFDSLRHTLHQNQESVISLRDDDGYSLLHWAALVGNLDACMHLLECGADVDAAGNNQQTPLMWACLKGHIAVINVLNNFGANIGCTDNMGASALIVAVQHNQLAVCLLLLKLQPSLLHSVDIKGCGVRFLCVQQL